MLNPHSTLWLGITNTLDVRPLVRRPPGNSYSESLYPENEFVVDHMMNILQLLDKGFDVTCNFTCGSD